MATIRGTEGNDFRTITNPQSFTFDGLGGVDTMSFGTTSESDYTITRTADGAVFEEKMGVDGTLVSESYILTRLTCRKGDRTVRLLMPFTREDTQGKDGSTLREVDGQLRITLKAGASQEDVPVTPVEITDTISLFGEGLEVPVVHGSALWKALLATGDNQLMALTGGIGAYVGVTKGKELRHFEKLCGLKP